MKSKFTFALLAILMAVGLVAALRLGQQEAEGPAARVSPPATAVADAASPVDEALGAVRNSQGAYAERLAALRALPRDLTAPQVEALKTFIAAPEGDEALRNTALVALLEQTRPAPGLGELMVQMAQDPEQSLRWRDYVYQNLPAAYGVVENRDAVLQALADRAQQPSGQEENLAGTALQALQRLEAAHPELPPQAKAMARAAVEADQAAGDAEKAVVAYQVLRATGDDSRLTEARRVAADEAALTRLRMSALSTLGTMGTSEDLALLKTLTTTAESRIRRVAKHQLEALQARLAQ